MTPDHKISPAGNAKSILLSIRVIFGAIISGMLLFAIVLVLVKDKAATISELEKYGTVSLAIAAVLGVTCLTLAASLYNRDLALAKSSLNPAAAKLIIYRTALIKYLALCEAPGLFGIILYYLTGNVLCLLVTAVMLIAMLIKLPLQNRVIETLELDWQDEQEIE